MTAAEHQKLLDADPVFVARQQESNRLITERIAQLKAEQRVLLEELHAIGLNIQLVSDLVNTSTKYEQAIPILLKHLKLPYSSATREAIARALAVPEARFAWRTLADEYCKSPVMENLSSVKDGLAAALAATATDAVIGDLINIAKDRSHGTTRVILLRALKKSKSPKAKQALEELASDPALAKEIASWKHSK